MAISNFRSFRDEAVLDLQRRGFTTKHPKAGSTWQESTWRRAALFGPNAAGKSNFLLSMGLLNQAVKHSLLRPELTKRLRDPHLGHIEEPTQFELEYVSDDIRYRWNLILDDEGVVEESLFASPVAHWRKVFVRRRSEISFGNEIGLPIAGKENISQFLRPWALTLSAWRTVKSPGTYSGAIDWWRTFFPLILSSDKDQTARHQWLVEMAQSNRKWLSILRKVVMVADVGIQDVGIAKHAPEDVKKIYARVNEDTAEDQVHLDGEELEALARHLVFHHGSGAGGFSLPEHEESYGTKAWLDLAIPALFALTFGGVLSVDEIDGSLHPLLVRELVEFFADPHLNTRGAQLLFSSHDLTLLGNHPDSPLDRGEVWFVEKADSYSELFALDEFPVREAHNIEKRYLQGRYGAVPLPASGDFVEILDELRSDYKLD
ncbi:AAA family ATPase [Corynebacterium kozikiae]|uniref:AAA family ATPase n=1 Tax=Corynebacterium kozikiae TaxID=2968469 RepID=UPI00211CCEB4|nr:ATP-binding protein [Corynebacterium sp. 76QC2CO]MCQ9343703.1 ATP-binding protein [Corynebacterium sp. 76QC2CO]